MEMSYKLGILDQSPIFPNMTSTDALNNTIELAKDAEKWGYSRFWVAEHHHMEKVAGVSPEILISHLLAHTKTIHIGSGGVMLQHYSPYKVVENFHVLSALAPGRVDLGVGKAPGGFDLSTKALQYGTRNDGSDINERLQFIKQLIDHDIPENHPFANLRAMPQPIVKPEIFLLGGSEQSATLAAELKVEFVFARFLNGSENDLKDAARIFHHHYPSGKLIVAVAVLAGETEQEALELAKDLKLYQIKFKDERTLIVQSYDQVEALKKQTADSFEVIEKELSILAGTAEQIKSELDHLHQQYRIDEFILHTPLLNRIKRLKSFELLSPENNKNVQSQQREKVSK